MASPSRVAVVGGGVAGLAAAKECTAAGLEVVGFEKCKELGGLWNPSSMYSHIWPSMRLNTSRRLVCFSDHPMPEPEGCDPFPTNKEYLDYVHSYCDRFGLPGLFKTEVTVDKVERTEVGKWRLTTNGQVSEEDFDYVVICVGNYVKPHKPQIPGAEVFKGIIAHAGEMKNYPLKGKRVVVQGSRISGSQLAAVGGTHGKACYHSQRSPRYHIELYAGNGQSSTELAMVRQRLWTRRFQTPEQISEGFKRVAMNPGKFGGKNAEPASDNVAKVGGALSHGYIKLLSEGKIVAKPGIDHLKENTVHFTDGSSVEADIICQATGYVPASQLIKDLLPAEVMEKVGGGKNLDLYKWTFHPELPTIAFVGLQRAMGSVIPCCELQARWLSGIFSGSLKFPSSGEINEWMEKERSVKSDANPLRMTREDSNMGMMMDALAWEAGCFPNLIWNFMSAYTLMSGTMFPAQYRISGPGYTTDALERVLHYNKHPLKKVPAAAVIQDTQDPPYQP